MGYGYNYHLKSSVIAKIFLMNCLLWATPCKAEKVFLSKEKLITSYLERTQLSIGEKLTRPSSNIPTNIHIVCRARKSCDDAALALKKYVKAQWLSPVQISRRDANSRLITLDLLNDNELGAQATDDQLELTYTDKQKVFSEGNKNCKVYGVIDGYEVTRIVILANMKIGEKRLVSCVLSTLARSAGLAFIQSYADQWKTGGELDAASEEVFAATMTGTARLLAIHLAPYTRPAINLGQFNLVTSSMDLWDILGEQ